METTTVIAPTTLDPIDVPTPADVSVYNLESDQTYEFPDGYTPVECLVMAYLRYTLKSDWWANMRECTDHYRPYVRVHGNTACLGDWKDSIGHYSLELRS